MKIGIYNEPQGGGIGGCEQCVAVLAGALAPGNQVEIVHHKPLMTREALAAASGVALHEVQMRYREPDTPPSKSSANPWRHYQASAHWHQDLSSPYDLFINFTHSVPPFCRAPRGVLVVLFPFYDRSEERRQGKGAASLIKQAYSDRLWNARLRGYQNRISISEFTRHWMERYWETQSQIIHPPVDTDFAVCAKEQTILSVGRFATSGHSKKQREMVAAFAEMQSGGHLTGWRYVCAGGLGELPAELAYFQEVTQCGLRADVKLAPNIERAELKCLYETSSIFWHAAGYGEDSDAHPRLMEHFGIATVEAMAAGCVPVVIKKGAQPELVEHGISGFLWETPEELQEYTLRLAEDDGLRRRMSITARERASRFSRETYTRRFRVLLGMAS